MWQHMPCVKVILYGSLRGRAGWSSREFVLNEGATLDDLLKQLENMIDELKYMISEMIVLVSGRPVSQRELRQVTLRDGDVVELLPSITGG